MRRCSYRYGYEKVAYSNERHTWKFAGPRGCVQIGAHPHGARSRGASKEMSRDVRRASSPLVCARAYGVHANEASFVARCAGEGAERVALAGVPLAGNGAAGGFSHDAGAPGERTEPSAARNDAACDVDGRWLVQALAIGDNRTLASSCIRLAFLMQALKRQHLGGIPPCDLGRSTLLSLFAMPPLKWRRTLFRDHGRRSA